MNRLYNTLGVKHARDLQALVMTMDFAFIRLLLIGSVVVAVILYLYYLPSIRLPRLAYSLSSSHSYEQLMVDEVAYHLTNLESGLDSLRRNGEAVERMFLSQYGVKTTAAKNKARELDADVLTPLTTHFALESLT